MSKLGIIVKEAKLESSEHIDVEVTAATRAAGQLRPGMIINERFRIERWLADGATSTVYEALDLSLDTRVAIKFLHVRLLSEDLAWKRFQQEGKTLSMLNQANIVKIFSIGLFQEMQPFLVMELVEGDRLSDLIARRGALPVETVIESAIGICQGLQEAHRRGIIHRDLKPHNISVSFEHGHAVTKILDFGIARLMPGFDAKEQKLTAAGTLLGTPGYMSPEQCSGIEVTEASDVYSLGCVMYEMTSGKALVSGTSIYDVMGHHLHGVNLQLPPTTPDALRNLIEACLIAEPANRITISELLKKLIDLQEDTQALKKHSLSGVQLIAIWRRRRNIYAVIAATILGVVLVGYVHRYTILMNIMELPYLRSQPSSLPVLTMLVKEFEKENDSASAYLACKNMLQLQEKTQPKAFDTTLTRYHLAQLCEKTDRQFEADALYQSVLNDMGQVISDADAAHKSFHINDQLDKFPPVSERTVATLENVQILHRYSTELIVARRFEKAEPVTLLAIKLSRLTNNSNRFMLPEVLVRRAQLLFHTKRYDGIDVLMKEKLKIEMEDRPEDFNHLAQSWELWGQYCAGAGNYPQAIQHYRTAIAMDERGARNLLAAHLREYAGILQLAGKQGEAEKARQRAFKLDGQLSDRRP